MSDAQTPTANDGICHEAAGNLAFLLSVVFEHSTTADKRCGELLSPAEEENVRRVIRDLGGPTDADIAFLRWLENTAPLTVKAWRLVYEDPEQRKSAEGMLGKV